MKYLGLVLLGILATAGAAHAAAKTVTLLGVSGPGGERLGNAIEKQLGELYDVVSGDVYRAQAAKLGMPGASQEEVAAVANALRIDAVIGASIVGTGKNRALMIAVREGATGRLIARGKYELGARPPKERIVADLVKALDMTSARPSSSAGSNSADTASSAGGGDATRATRRAPAKSDGGPIGVALSVGPELLGRTLVIDGGMAPGYDSGALVGLQVQGALFPFALAKGFAKEHPVLASFGLLGGYTHVFGSSVTTTSGTSAVHGDQYDLLFAGRIPLGHQAVGGYFQLETGWQHVSFYHDQPSAVGVPNVSYELLDFGLSWERRLGVDWALLSARFAYLQPLAAGDIVDASQYGRASAWGIEAGGGVTFFPLRWLWLRLDAKYSRVGLNFRGNGTLQATTGADAYPSGSLALGFAL